MERIGRMSVACLVGGLLVLTVWAALRGPARAQGQAPADGAQVLIAAVLYDGYQLNDADEAVQLVNVGAAPVDLTGWRLDDDVASASYAVFPGGTLQPGQRIWVAWKAMSFTLSFGFPPDYEVVDTDPDVANLTGSWPGYANGGDEVVLRDGADQVVDLVIYKACLLYTSPSPRDS